MLGPEVSLARLVLLPVVLALALVAALVAVLSVSAGRHAAGDELQNRADTVRQVAGQALARRQARLRAGGASRADFVATRGRGGRTDVSRGRRWARLPAVRELARGSSKRAVAATGKGEALLLVALPRAGGERLILGEPLSARDLDSLARPLGAGLAIVPRDGAGVDADGLRSYVYALDEAGGGNARLQVSLPTDSLANAMQVPLIAGLAAVLAIAALLAWLIRRLLARAVTAPLHRLEVAMARTGEGDLRVRAEVEGSPEIARAGERFNRMAAALVEREQRLEADAAKDPLTGLANAHRLEEMVGIEIKRSQRDATPFAVAAFDIDGFGRHNERLGREGADDLLREIAAELLRATRDTDVVARVQADEFVLLLLGVEGDVALSVIDRLRTAVANAGNGVSVGTSVGWSCYPADGHDAGTLLEGAEGALDWARRGGPGSVRRFDSRHVVLRGNEEQRSQVLSVLERDDGLTVVFQPIVSLSTGKIIGFEALARFPNGPKRGPDVWFAQAHRCGLGAQLEAKAVRTALLFPGRPPGSWLSVNLSPNALASDELRGVLPDNLEGLVIELTEHEQIWDDEALQERLGDLRRRGAKIAVDDAGAGYSGLQQVMRIQPDIIKLDRSLIRGVDDDLAKAALIDSIVRFARRAGATVCGEGIETEEELRALADLDVSCGQGYLLARPGAPWPTVLAWVSETLLPRTLRRRDSDTHQVPQLGDQPLEPVSSELARVTTIGELVQLAPRLARELGAEELVLMRHRRADMSLEPLSHVDWIGDAQLRVPGYRALANVLQTQDSVQVLLSDPGGELGELALLGNSGHASMLIVPMVSRAESVGLLIALSHAERPWTRDQNGRARIVANQVGGLFELLEGRTLLAR